MVYQSFLLEVSSWVSSSQCHPVCWPAVCWPDIRGSRAPKHRWWVVWCATAMGPDFILLSCRFSSPLHRCYFLKGLTWMWQIVSWFTLMFLYNMWGISVALERCSKKPCSFSKELQIANSLKAVRNPTFFWSLGASTISIYFECCQGAASAFYSVIVLQNAE